MKKLFLNTLITVMAVLLLSSCKEEDNNSYTVPFDAVWQIVTLESTGTSGSVFSFSKSADSETITLTCSNNLSDLGLPANSRIIIAYKPATGVNPYQSGPINLYGASLLTGTITFKGTPGKYNGWKSDPLVVQTLNRTGKYINITATGHYYKRPTLYMVLDDSTLDNEYPDAYIIFLTDDVVNQSVHTIYGSFSLEDVWSKSTCKGVNVHYQGQTKRESEIFKKNLGPLTPTTPDDEQ